MNSFFTIDDVGPLERKAYGDTARQVVRRLKDHREEEVKRLLALLPNMLLTDRKTTRKPPRRTMFGRFTERHPDESSFKPLESSSSSDSAFDGGPRFIPGRAGVTVGYLLPLGRELQFNFEEPPDTDTAECDRFHALMLLSCWEETIEAHERASYWIAKKEHEKEEKEGNAKLKGAVRAQGLALKLQAAKKKREENGGADGVRDSLIAPAARQSKATFPGGHDRV